VDECKPLVAGNGKEALAAIERAAPSYHLAGRCRLTP
jgi:hypothetical protein